MKNRSDTFSRKSYLVQLSRDRPLVAFFHIFTLLVSLLFYIINGDRYLTEFPVIEELISWEGIIESAKFCSGLRCSSKSSITLKLDDQVKEFRLTLIRQSIEELNTFSGKKAVLHEYPRNYFEIFPSQPYVAQINIKDSDKSWLDYHQTRKRALMKKEAAFASILHMGLVIIINLIFIVIQVFKQKNIFSKFSTSETLREILAKES